MNDGLVPGPAGPLEIAGEGAPGDALLILCHPHPLHGGNLHDAVLGHLAAGARTAGWANLRFNFRGVGRSSGSHDGGDGECEDLRAIIAWATDVLQPSALALGGYSFGSHIAWAEAPEVSALQRLLLVAPPFGHLHYGSHGAPAPTLVLAGDRDPFLDETALQAFLAAAGPAARGERIAGADHFFGSAAAQDALQRAVATFLDAG